jgi:hypothetical protein
VLSGSRTPPVLWASAMTRAAVAAFLVAAAIGSGFAAGREATADPLRTLVTVSLPGEPANPVLVSGSVWMSIPAEAIVLRLDARSGRRLGRIDVTRRDRRAFGGGPLAAWRGIVWVAAPVHVDDDPSLPPDNSGWIGRLETRTGRMRITFVRGDPPAAIAAGPAGVWVSGGHTLRQVDPRTGRVVVSRPLEPLLGDVAVGADRVWVDAPRAATVLGVDTATRKVVSRVRVGRTSGSGSLALGKLLWAATDAGVVGVDQHTGRIARRVAVPRPQGIAVDGRDVWVYAPSGLYSVTAAGIAKREFATASPAFGAVVARRGAIWLSDSVTRTLRRVGR